MQIFSFNFFIHSLLVILLWATHLFIFAFYCKTHKHTHTQQTIEQIRNKCQRTKSTQKQNNFPFSFFLYSSHFHLFIIWLSENMYIMNIWCFNIQILYIHILKSRTYVFFPYICIHSFNYLCIIIVLFFRFIIIVVLHLFANFSIY